MHFYKEKKKGKGGENNGNKANKNIDSKVDNIISLSIHYFSKETPMWVSNILILQKLLYLLNYFTYFLVKSGQKWNT